MLLTLTAGCERATDPSVVEEERVLAPRGAVANLINRGYEQRGDLVTEIIDEMPLDESAFASAAAGVGQGGTDLLALARQTPVIRLVNMILFEAVRRRASGSR